MVLNEGRSPMKVRDLVSKLKTLDQELDLFCYCDSDLSRPAGHGQPYAVLEVAPVRAETTRDKDRRPQIVFGGGPESRPLVILEITPDF